MTKLWRIITVAAVLLAGGAARAGDSDPEAEARALKLDTAKLVAYETSTAALIELDKGYLRRASDAIGANSPFPDDWVKDIEKLGDDGAGGPTERPVITRRQRRARRSSMWAHVGGPRMMYGVRARRIDRRRGFVGRASRTRFASSSDVPSATSKSSAPTVRLPSNRRRS